MPFSLCSFDASPSVPSRAKRVILRILMEISALSSIMYRYCERRIDPVVINDFGSSTVSCSLMQNRQNRVCVLAKRTRHKVTNYDKIQQARNIYMFCILLANIYVNLYNVKIYKRSVFSNTSALHNGLATK